MSTVKEAARDLLAALGAVDDLRVYADPGASVAPPGVVLGPPTLTWEGMCAEPTSATFLVYLVTQLDDRSLERLWDLVPLVAAAVDAMPDAVVRTASPGSFLSGGTELPAYLIETEVAL